MDSGDPGFPIGLQLGRHLITCRLHQTNIVRKWRIRRCQTNIVRIRRWWGRLEHHRGLPGCGQLPHAASLPAADPVRLRILAELKNLGGLGVPQRLDAVEPHLRVGLLRVEIDPGDQ